MEINQDKVAPSGPPPLARNWISFAGSAIGLAMFAILIVLAGSDLLFHTLGVELLFLSKSPYSSLVTYILLPSVMFAGLGLVVIGMLLEARRRRKIDPNLHPLSMRIDLNEDRLRRRAMFGVLAVGGIFGMSSVGTYQAYQFTESPVFCGLVCHEVMKPEYEAYLFSPHARISCAECHIGPGAEYYLRSKFRGMGQLWGVMANSYHLPIETPIENMRPAQETCEHCHWSDKLFDSIEKKIWHFSPDRTNTAHRFDLLLKVGGGSKDLGVIEGIHWHISPDVEVRYWAREGDRQDIPWVEVNRGDDEPVVFRSPDCPDPLPPDAEIRRMDCMDCHNRPAHQFKSPDSVLDAYLARGALDASLPYFKRHARELLERDWPDTPTALAGIADGLTEKYANRMQGELGAQIVAQNIEWVQRLYQRNIFPEQNVDWREYPDNIGHFEFPGCYRCHDDKHESPSGRVIPNDCTLCHEILGQAEGPAAYQAKSYEAGEFIHPRGLADVWKGKNCTDCHGVNQHVEASEP